MATTKAAPRRQVSKPKRRTRRRRAPRILNVLPSKNVEQDWAFENAASAGYIAAAPRIPATKDLRAKWWKVGDQSTTGSCVGWATADSVLRWMFVDAGRIKPADRLSVRFIWMAAKETDEFTSQPSTFIEEDGTSLKAALDIARKYGVVPEIALPFKTGALYPDPAKTFYALAARLKISSYYNLGSNFGNWRTWLARNGPILARLDVDTTFENASKANHGRLDVYQPHTASGGHAVAIVGYTSTAFIIRNSWGTGWGDKGFAYATWSYTEAAFTEAYGVAV